MIEGGTWIQQQAPPSGFAATSNSDDVICFKCGERGHKSNTCKKPQNDKGRAAMERFQKLKRKSGPGQKEKTGWGLGDQWPKPQGNDPLKKEIKGRPYYFSKKDQRWKIDKAKEKEKKEKKKKEEAEKVLLAKGTQPTPGTIS